MNKTLRYGILLTLVITVINVAFSVLFRLIARELPESVWLRFFAVLAASLLSGLLIAAIVIFTAPVLRDWLLTYRRLSRLENINHPLLIRLSKEAPGTYHHTLLVADLAAKAAKLVGADPLLTRIAGYFHDIGKLTAPEYFVENQRGKNPHDTLHDPLKSSQIIIGHVKEGVTLAKKHGLPKEILDCIPQHHGTLVLKQFYEEARRAYSSVGPEAKGKDPSVKSSQFRYPGPRPLSREAALLMLADNSEARVRALPNKTQAAVRDAVDEAIAERYRERQLDLSGLRQEDFQAIRDSFTESFLSLHHRRLAKEKEVCPASTLT